MDAPVPPTDDLALFPRQFVKILTVIQIVCLAILVGVVGVELCLGRGVNFTIHPNVGFLNLSLGRSATSFFGCGGLLGVGVLVFYRLGLRLVANLNSRAVVTALAIYMAMSLAASLAGSVRVNSISPGWIDTSFRKYDGPDASQHFVGRVGNPMDIANMVLYLASDKAGFISGENICIDGGMTRNMIYHNDFGWRLEK